ncbi:MAG TPA: NUDIX domain-containing protein [Gemmatimonadaceae bacterium]|nr:NUDIX domain-containing protein [Gemmatimonadaceae bacterium]
MRERSIAAQRPSVRAVTAAIDLALLTPRDGSLAVLLLRSADARARDRWLLPWDAPRHEEPPDQAAMRLARGVLGVPPAALEQIAAFGNGRRHPGEAQLSVSFVGLVPHNPAAQSADNALWVDIEQLPLLAPRHRAIVDAAVDVVRKRIDQSPLAFRLLPPSFTLSELQAIYELLLGRPLHKASFRRALQAALLVEPTDEWRSEGRGRPAQLYRYAPRRRRGTRRGVRFDLIAD